MPTREEEARAAYDQGLSLFDRGLDIAALEQLRRAIEINPELTPAHITVGSIYLERRDYREAERSFARAAQLEPRNFDAQFGHGRSLHLLSRLVEAVRAYLVALSIRPDDFDANLNVAIAYLDLREPHQALMYAQRAVRLGGQSATARIALGDAHVALGDHESAIVEYQQAAELAPITSDLLLKLARSLDAAGRLGEMESVLTQLIAVEPSAVAHERMASCYFRTGRYGEALEEFRRALSMDPSHYPALNGVGVCLLNQYLMSGRSDRAARAEALDALRASLRINGRQPRVVELLARYR